MTGPNLTLKDFYCDMQRWIELGVNHQNFCQDFGLCYNLKLWCKSHNLTSTATGELENEMMDQFLEIFETDAYPFDETFEQYEKSDLYKNPARLKWIEEHARSD